MSDTGDAKMKTQFLLAELARRFFEVIELGLMVVDPSGKIIMWNLWMSKASRIASFEVLGKSVVEVFPEIEGTRLKKGIDQALKHGMPSLPSLARNNAQFPLFRPFQNSDEMMRQLIVIKPTRLLGSDWYCVVQISDVSSAALREEMLLKQAHELELAQAMVLNTAAERKRQAVMREREKVEAQMAGGFAHEMRNALSGGNLLLMRALGLVGDDEGGGSLCTETRTNLAKIHQIMVEAGVEDSVRESIDSKLRCINQSEKELDYVLNIVHGATERALMITKQIMQYSRSGFSSRGTDEIDIGELVASIVEESREEYELQGVSVAQTLPAGLVIEGESLHFYSIVKNLVQNSRDSILEKFKGDEGGLIEIEVQKREDGWSVVVADNGVGIAEEARSKVFGAFFSTKPETGTGLGLGMVEKLVTLYDGTIELESTVGEGACFSLVFKNYANAVGGITTSTGD